MEDRFIDNHFIWLLANWLWPAYVINSNCSVNNGTTVYFQSSSSIDFVPCRLSSSIDDNKIRSWIVSFLASDVGADNNMECMDQIIHLYTLTRKKAQMQGAHGLSMKK